MEIVEIIVAVIGSLGGFELIKWIYTRKSKGRLAQAEADIANIKARSDEYQLLRERIDNLNVQMIEKEKRFTEQTDYVRKLNRELIAKEAENGTLRSRISELETERAMKLCQVRGCANRQPQSGY